MTKKTTFRLTEAEREQLTELGGGNMAKGLRLLLCNEANRQLLINVQSDMRKGKLNE